VTAGRHALCRSDTIDAPMLEVWMHFMNRDFNFLQIGKPE
jgi:hypothetical protein